MIKSTSRLISNLLRTNMSTRNTDVIISPELNSLLGIPWIKCHLCNLGADLLRFKSYRKLNNLLFAGGAGVIKAVVHDMTTFIRKELNLDSETAKQLRELIGNAIAEHQLTSNYNIGTSKWLYILPGYLQLSNQDVDDFIDKIIDIYLNTRRPTYLSLQPTQEPQEMEILLVFRNYFHDVTINELVLFSSRPKYITLHETNDSKIFLPPLPRIQNRELLAKALMHKESYRGLLKPSHAVATTLSAMGYPLNPKSYTVVRYELSFLDGLGDFFLARESSKLLYQIYSSDIYRIHSHIYNLIKIMLVTNTVLSKLTLAYNLHRGLNDDILNNTIANEYVPYYVTGKEHPYMDAEETRVYEEEFLGDYFEGYVGALFLELPEVAETFVHEIYASILKTITRTLPPDVTYANWTTGIMGRSLAYKKTEAT